MQLKVLLLLNFSIAHSYCAQGTRKSRLASNLFDGIAEEDNRVESLRRWVTSPVLTVLGISLLLSGLVFVLHDRFAVYPTPPPAENWERYPAGWSARGSGGTMNTGMRPAVLTQPEGAGVFAFLAGEPALARWQYSAATGALSAPQRTGLAAAGRPAGVRVVPAAGGYHVVWYESVPGGQQPLYARLDAELRLVTGPVRLGAVTLECDLPAVAPLPDGDALVVWNGYLSPGGYRLWWGRVRGGELTAVQQGPEGGRLPQALAGGDGVDVAYARVAPQANPPLAYLRLTAAGAPAGSPERVNPGFDFIRSIELLRRPAGGVALLVGQRHPGTQASPELAVLLQRPADGPWGQPLALQRSQPLYDLAGTISGDRVHLVWTDLVTPEPGIFYREVPLTGGRPGEPVLVSAPMGDGGNRYAAVAAWDKGVAAFWSEYSTGSGELRLRDTLHPQPPPAAARLGLDPANPVKNALFVAVSGMAQAVLGMLGGMLVIIILGIGLALTAGRLPEHWRGKDWLLFGLVAAGAWVSAWVASPLQLAPLWPLAQPWPLWALLVAPLAASAAVAMLMRLRQWQPASEVLVIPLLTALWLYFHRLVLALPFAAGFR